MDSTELYPNLTVKSIQIRTTSHTPAVALLFLLNDSPIDILTGYEYLLHRFTYIYELIKNQIDSKYIIYKNLWTNNSYATMGLYFPPVTPTDFTSSYFMVIAFDVDISENDCSTFHKFAPNNYYYNNDFKFITVYPQDYSKDYKALTLVVPKPFKYANEKLRERYIDKPIKNINQFEKFYSQEEKNQFYTMTIQKVYETIIIQNKGVTLWFAGAQIGCLHAKITDIPSYSIGVLGNRLSFDKSPIFDIIMDEYEHRETDLFLLYVFELFYLNLCTKFDPSTTSIVKSNYQSILNHAAFIPIIKHIMLIVDPENEGLIDEDFVSGFIDEILIIDYVMHDVSYGGSRGNNYKEKYLVTKKKYMLSKATLKSSSDVIIPKEGSELTLEKELKAKFPTYKNHIINRIATLAEGKNVTSVNLFKVPKKDISTIQLICEKYFKPRYNYKFLDELYQYIESIANNLDSYIISLIVSSISIDNVENTFKYLKLETNLQNKIMKFMEGNKN
jgi:hypothetical protein